MRKGGSFLPYNQIARSANAGIARAEDAKQAIYLLGQVYELMFRIANK